MNATEFHSVSHRCETAGKRADLVLVEAFPKFSRTHIQRAFAAGLIQLNGVTIPAKTKVQVGDLLGGKIPALPATEVRPREANLDVLWEDDDLLAVAKPAGEIVHPGSGTKDTLVEAVLAHTNGKLALAGGTQRPGVVHRLDKETSGILLFAKTNDAYYALTKAFANREIHKFYHALVAGVPQVLSGTIKEPIGRDPHVRTRMTIRHDGRFAHTDWKREKVLYHKRIALLKLTLHTGRTHQIRVHLAHLGFPILGDTTYGYSKNRFPELEIPRIMLHASEVSLLHPISQKPIHLVCPFPEDMANMLHFLEI